MYFFYSDPAIFSEGSEFDSHPKSGCDINIYLYNLYVFIEKKKCGYISQRLIITSALRRPCAYVKDIYYSLDYLTIKWFI